MDPGYGAAALSFPDGWEYAEQACEEYAIVEDDPLSAEARSRWTISVARGDWRVRVETRSTLSCDADSFVLDNQLDAFDAGQRVFSRNWAARLPRDDV